MLEVFCHPTKRGWGKTIVTTVTIVTIATIATILTIVTIVTIVTICDDQRRLDFVFCFV